MPSICTRSFALALPVALLGASGCVGPGCDLLVAPDRDDIVDETVDGLSIQSEQSVVSTIRTITMAPENAPNETTVDRDRIITVGYNDTAELRANLLACLAAGGSEEKCEEDTVLYRPGFSMMGFAVSLGDGRGFAPELIGLPVVDEDLGAFFGDPWLTVGPREFIDIERRTIGGTDFIVATRNAEVFYGNIASTIFDARDDRRWLAIAHSTDGGETFDEPQLLDTRDPENVDPACGNMDRLTLDADRTAVDRVYVSWSVGDGCGGWFPARLDGPLVGKVLPDCGTTTSVTNTQVRVRQTDGRPFAIIQGFDGGDELGPEDDIRFLCVSTLEADDEWRELGRIAEGFDARTTAPAHAGSSMRLPLLFSFDIPPEGDRLVVAFPDRVFVQDVAVDHVMVLDVEIDADGNLGDVLAEEQVRGSVEEFQSQPAVSSASGRVGVSFYETVTDSAAGEVPSIADTVVMVGASRSDAGAWSSFVLSDESFEPCPTVPVTYFGDYIGMAPIVNVTTEQRGFVTAWADARDGCLEQDTLADTWHQHTYADTWF